jgi:hypothetical protein
LGHVEHLARPNKEVGQLSLARPLWTPQLPGPI